MRSSKEIKQVLDAVNADFEALSAKVRTGVVDEKIVYQMAIAGRSASLLEWVLESNADEVLEEKQEALSNLEEQLRDVEEAKEKYFPVVYNGQFDNTERRIRERMAVLRMEIKKLEEGDRT